MIAGTLVKMFKKQESQGAYGKADSEVVKKKKNHSIVVAQKRILVALYKFNSPAKNSQVLVVLERFAPKSTQYTRVFVCWCLASAGLSAPKRQEPVKKLADPILV